MILKEIKKAEHKTVSAQTDENINTPDFHVRSLEDSTLLTLHNGGTDDVDSFNCDMYNFDDMEDLPESDRQMIPSDQICRSEKKF